MRSYTLSWIAVASCLGLGSSIAACGTESSNGLFSGAGAVDTGAGDNGTSSGSASSSSGTTVFGGNVDVDAALPMACVPKTCTELGADCGFLDDGCGGFVECAPASSCPSGQTCGGAGMVGKCGTPPCTIRTCAQQGVECGATGDGCGGLITNCGTCEAGTCGGGGPSKCGGTSSGDGGGACVPTKTTCGPGDCGPISDGCGAVLTCPTSCPTGQTCGGGGVASLCGAPACTKNTCAGSGGADCGVLADGCGGLLSCWPAGGTCPPGKTCGGAGGAGSANHCGTSPTCTGLCLQQQGCAGGGSTSIEGYVTSPNGLLPIPNAVVYVPNGVVQPFTQGVACEQCAAPSGSPLVTTTTDANGHFFLPNMPVSSATGVQDIPVVAQLGRWRKKFTVQTTACTNNVVRASGALPWPAALPRDKSEGDIPLTAISTGNADALECVFKKVGVADSEFTKGDGMGRIRIYPQNGACAAGGCTPSASLLYAPATSNANGTVSGATGNNVTPIVLTTSAAHNLATGAVVTVTGVRGNTAARGTWNITVVDATRFALDGSTGNGAWSSGGTQKWAGCAGASCTAEIDKYDAVIFGCEGGENAKGVDGRANIVRYANNGGRVFATHFSYVWLQPQYPWGGTVTGWDTGAAPSWDGGIQAFLDTSFPKGVLFSNWLQAPVLPSATFPPPYSAVNALYSTAPASILVKEARRNVKMDAEPGTVGAAQRWAYTTPSSARSAPATDSAATNGIMHYTFNTDVNKPAAQQCGRVTFSDFHVTTTGSTNGVTFPAECGTSGLTSQEKVLAYMLFDLASCVSSTPPQTCQAQTCGDQGIGCGPAGDGCGNPISCGDCPSGKTCGGGGVPSQCGAPSCTPRTCAIGQCGLAGDGCGGTLTCGGCQTGQICGGGGMAGMCGTGTTCNPSVCPAPSMGSLCGPVADGCGSVNNCGCPTNVPCVNGTCGVPACTARTCASAGANCGQAGDGCGGTLSCGVCVAPQTCGGGGIANVCGGGVR